MDYFIARYYSAAQGRFTSPDEFAGGPDEFWVLGSGDGKNQALPYAEIADPQTLNKYQYCLNNPLRYIDPDGHQQKLTEQLKQNSVAATLASGGLVKVGADSLQLFTKGTAVIGASASAAKGTLIASGNKLSDKMQRMASKTGNSLQRLGDQIYGSGERLLGQIAASGSAAGKAIFGTSNSGITLDPNKPDDAFVVRGGTNNPENFINGSGVSVNANGILDGVSTQSAPGLSIKELSKTIPNNQIGVTTISRIEAAGGTIVHSPGTNGRNPYHYTLSGLTAEQASNLFQPTIRNPNKP
jgi:RHS repeat-associated protein